MEGLLQVFIPTTYKRIWFKSEPTLVAFIAGMPKIKPAFHYMTASQWKRKHITGGEAIAADPNNPNIVYMAAGKYSQWQPKGSIFKSTDQGENWTKLNINLGIDSNVEHCWAGKRLAVNLANSNIIFFGSRHDGVWRSSNAGATMGESRNFIPNAYQRRWHLVRVGGSRCNSTYRSSITLVR